MGNVAFLALVRPFLPPVSRPTFRFSTSSRRKDIVRPFGTAAESWVGWGGGVEGTRRQSREGKRGVPVISMRIFHQRLFAAKVLISDKEKSMKLFSASLPAAVSTL